MNSNKNQSPAKWLDRWLGQIYSTIFKAFMNRSFGEDKFLPGIEWEYGSSQNIKIIISMHRNNEDNENHIVQTHFWNTSSNDALYVFSLKQSWTYF